FASSYISLLQSNSFFFPLEPTLTCQNDASFVPPVVEVHDGLIGYAKGTLVFERSVGNVQTKFVGMGNVDMIQRNGTCNDFLDADLIQLVQQCTIKHIPIGNDDDFLPHCIM